MVHDKPVPSNNGGDFEAILVLSDIDPTVKTRKAMAINWAGS